MAYLSCHLWLKFRFITIRSCRSSRIINTVNKLHIFADMKASEKKSLRKEGVRANILNAAKKLFVQEGYHGASIRKIASEIGCSPTTIYLYYADKNDIVYALSQEGFVILRTLFSSLHNVEAPFERLKALGRTYLKFAREHPDYYEVMFMLKEPMEFLNSKEGEECWMEGIQTFDVLVSTVVDCQKEGFFRGTKPESVALQAWAVVHGLSSLYITSRLQKMSEERYTEDADELIESSFQTYAGFLEATKR